MNLVENYIKKIYSEEDITEEYREQIKKEPSEKLIQVDIEYNCYGSVRRDKMTFIQSMWEEAKRKGYFLGQNNDFIKEMEERLWI